jgi:hypothetical protein
MLATSDTWIVLARTAHRPRRGVAGETIQTTPKETLLDEERGDVRPMNLAKTLAVSAVAGMLMGSAIGCGGSKDATPAPSDPSAASGGKASCSASGGAAPASSGKSSCSAAGGGKASCSASGAAAPKY